jgi:hypothetical protein
MGDVEEKDKVRDEWLNILGFRVIRFDGNLISNEPEKVLEEIQKILRSYKAGLELCVAAKLLHSGKEIKRTSKLKGDVPYSASFVLDLLESLSRDLTRRLELGRWVYGYSPRTRQRA